MSSTSSVSSSPETLSTSSFASTSAPAPSANQSRYVIERLRKARELFSVKERQVSQQHQYQQQQEYQQHHNQQRQQRQQQRHRHQRQVRPDPIPVQSLVKRLKKVSSQYQGNHSTNRNSNNQNNDDNNYAEAIPRDFRPRSSSTGKIRSDGSKSLIIERGGRGHDRDSLITDGEGRDGVHSHGQSRGQGRGHSSSGRVTVGHGNRHHRTIPRSMPNLIPTSYFGTNRIFIKDNLIKSNISNNFSSIRDFASRNSLSGNGQGRGDNDGRMSIFDGVSLPGRSFGHQQQPQRHQKLQQLNQMRLEQDPLTKKPDTCPTVPSSRDIPLLVPDGDGRVQPIILNVEKQKQIKEIEKEARKYQSDGNDNHDKAEDDEKNKSKITVIPEESGDENSNAGEENVSHDSKIKENENKEAQKLLLSKVGDKEQGKEEEENRSDNNKKLDFNLERFKTLAKRRIVKIDTRKYPFVGDDDCSVCSNNTNYSTKSLPIIKKKRNRNHKQKRKKNSQPSQYQYSNDDMIGTITKNEEKEYLQDYYSERNAKTRYTNTEYNRIGTLQDYSERSTKRYDSDRSEQNYFLKDHPRRSTTTRYDNDGMREKELLEGYSGRSTTVKFNDNNRIEEKEMLQDYSVRSMPATATYSITECDNFATIQDYSERPRKRYNDYDNEENESFQDFLNRTTPGRYRNNERDIVGMKTKTNTTAIGNNTGSNIRSRSTGRHRHRRRSPSSPSTIKKSSKKIKKKPKKKNLHEKNKTRKNNDNVIIRHDYIENHQNVSLSHSTESKWMSPFTWLTNKTNNNNHQKNERTESNSSGDDKFKEKEVDEESSLSSTTPQQQEHDTLPSCQNVDPLLGNSNYVLAQLCNLMEGEKMESLIATSMQASSSQKKAKGETKNSEPVIKFDGKGNDRGQIKDSTDEKQEPAIPILRPPPPPMPPSQQDYEKNPKVEETEKPHPSITTVEFDEGVYVDDDSLLGTAMEQRPKKAVQSLSFSLIVMGIVGVLFVVNMFPLDDKNVTSSTQHYYTSQESFVDTTTTTTTARTILLSPPIIEEESIVDYHYDDIDSPPESEFLSASKKPTVTAATTAATKKTVHSEKSKLYYTIPAVTSSSIIGTQQVYATTSLKNNKIVPSSSTIDSLNADTTDTIHAVKNNEILESISVIDTPKTGAATITSSGKNNFVFSLIRGIKRWFQKKLSL